MVDLVPFTGLIAGNLKATYAANVVVVTGTGGKVNVNQNIYIDSSGNVGIGTSSPAQTLHVGGNSKVTGHIAIGNNASVNKLNVGTNYPDRVWTVPAVITIQDKQVGNLAINDFVSAVTSYVEYKHTGASAGYIYDHDYEPQIPNDSTGDISYFDTLYLGPSNRGSGNISSMTTVEIFCSNLGSGNIGQMEGIIINGRHGGTGNISWGVGLDIYPTSITSTGNITNNAGIYINPVTHSGAGTVTNAYGIYIDNQASSGTNAWNLYSAGPGLNYFGGNVGIGTTSTAYKLEVNGSFAATTKSFLINHPTKPGMKLQYGSLESPYHGIRLTGEAALVGGICTVQLPDYIRELCYQEGAQVQLTNVKHGKVLWVEDLSVSTSQFTVAAKIAKTDKKPYKFYWSFTAIRKDIDPLQVEF